MLVGHGRVFGYAESSSERVIRGHRLLCSNRHRREGCGRTVTVWLAAILPGRIVRTATIFAYVAAVATGSSAAAAWREASSMTLRTGYRIRRRLALAGPGIRTALLSRAPPPPVESPSTDAQLLAHVRAALGADVTSFDRFQLGLPTPRPSVIARPRIHPNHETDSSFPRPPTRDADIRPQSTRRYRRLPEPEKESAREASQHLPT